MTIRFLADASLHHGIVRATRLREPAIDFLSAVDAKLAGLDDAQVLAIAAAENRILVCSDRRTMPAAFGAFLRSEGRSPGVILVSQRVPIATAADSLLLLWAASTAEEWQNRIFSIPL